MQKKQLPAHKKKVFYTLTTIMIIVSSLILLEIGVRIWVYFKPIPKVPNTRYTYSPYLPYVPRPNHIDTIKNTFHNDRGFRNSYNVLMPKKDNTYRIVCLGGSTTYSDYDNASNEQIWTGRLEHYLNKEGNKKYEVINASGHNYTTYMNFIDYLTRIRDLEVDMIIIYEGANELYFGGYDDTSFVHYNVFRQVGFDEVNETIDTYNNNFFINNLMILKKLYAKMYLTTSLNEMSTKHSHYNASVNIDNMKKNDLLTFRKGLEGFNAIAISDNAQLIFLSQAYNFEKIRKQLASANPGMVSSYIEDYIREAGRVADTMEAYSGRNSIPFLDMNKVLNQQDEYFYKNPIDGVHFSIKGEDVFAENLCNFIKDYIPE